MTQTFVLLICALITYRLARLLVVDEGLFSVFFLLREYAGVYDEDVRGQPSAELGKLLSCVHCTGFWVSMPVALIAYGWHGLYMFLAVAGLQSFLHSVVENR